MGRTGRDVLGALDEGPARLGAPEVAASQRRRMLAAMVAAVAEKGYVAVSVADVVKAARVSRATFYDQFTGKADCFIAAFHACVDDIVGKLREASPTSVPPRARLRRLLQAYLGELAAFPEGARVCLVEIYAAGPEAALHRRQIQLDFVALLRSLHGGLVAAGEAPAGELTDFDLEAVVGAVSSLATTRVAAGEAASLPDLLDDIEAFVVRNLGAATP